MHLGFCLHHLRSHLLCLGWGLRLNMLNSHHRLYYLCGLSVYFMHFMYCWLLPHLGLPFSLVLALSRPMRHLHQQHSLPHLHLTIHHNKQPLSVLSPHLPQLSPDHLRHLQHRHRQLYDLHQHLPNLMLILLPRLLPLLQRPFLHPLSRQLSGLLLHDGVHHL